MKIIVLCIISIMIFTGCDNKSSSKKYHVYTRDDINKRPNYPREDNITNVSKIDIKGIHLGDVYEQISSNVIEPFRKRQYIERKMTGEEIIMFGKTPPEVIELKKFVKENDTGFKMNNYRTGNDKVSISFDNNHKVYFCRRSKHLSVIPDLDLIKQQLFEKYGKPDKEMKTKAGLIFCWGACAQTEYRITQAYYDKSLHIEYTEYDKKTEGTIASIIFELYDPILGDKYSAWKRKLKEDYKKEIEKRMKAEASDLQL